MGPPNCPLPLLLISPLTVAREEILSMASTHDKMWIASHTNQHPDNLNPKWLCFALFLVIHAAVTLDQFLSFRHAKLMSSSLGTVTLLHFEIGDVSSESCLWPSKTGDVFSKSFLWLRCSQKLSLTPC